MTKIIIKNAKIINEMQQFEADLAIENGKIALISTRKGYGIEKLKELIINYKSLSIVPCIYRS